jgi:hypothetical protein
MLLVGLGERVSPFPPEYASGQPVNPDQVRDGCFCHHGCWPQSVTKQSSQAPALPASAGAAALLNYYGAVRYTTQHHIRFVHSVCRLAPKLS